MVLTVIVLSQVSVTVVMVEGRKVIYGKGGLDGSGG